MTDMTRDMTRILPILRCPRCGTVAPFGSTEAPLTCRACSARYEVRDGIPDFAPDDVRERASSSPAEVLAASDLGEDRRVTLANLVLYDKKAGFYDDQGAVRRLRTPRADRRIREALARAREIAGGDRLLDCGTGTGLIAGHGEEIFGTVVGLDLSVEMMRRNRARRAILVRGDLLGAPFADGAFDVVASASLIHILARPADYLREVGRLLKPGGVFFADNEPNGIAQHVAERPVYAALRGWVRGYRPGGGDDAESRLNRLATYQDFNAGLDPADLRRALEAAGFDEIGIIHHADPASIFRFPLLGGSPGRQAAQILRFLLSFHLPYRELSPLLAIFARKALGRAAAPTG